MRLRITLTSWEARILRRRSFLAALERRAKNSSRLLKLIGSSGARLILHPVEFFELLPREVCRND